MRGTVRCWPVGGDIYGAKIMKTACLILILICLLPVSHGGKPQAPNAIPIIRLDKTRFALGESISFWVGVEQTGHAPIAKQYRKTCRLIITRPDGTQKTEVVSWPIDGPEDKGWVGGSGLGEGNTQPGRYTLVFEFAGQQTSPAFLFVEDAPILSQIKTSFAFGPMGQEAATPLDVHLPTSEIITLIVHNGSEQTLRFPLLNVAGPSVSVSIRRVDGSYANDFFYPDDKLLGKGKPEAGAIAYDKLTWDFAREIPMITLPPGETFRRELSLQAAFDEARKNLPLASGEYRITFKTELQMMIGAKEGRWAELSPVRLSVGSTLTCKVTV